MCVWGGGGLRSRMGYENSLCHALVIHVYVMRLLLCLYTKV